MLMDVPIRRVVRAWYIEADPICSGAEDCSYKVEAAVTTTIFAREDIFVQFIDNLYR